jgi:putative MATE family efflux protein
MIEGKNLTEGSLAKNLISMALPLMLSNFIQVVYNLTDTYWLGQMAEGATEAVAITGICFPLVFFFSSFGHGFAVASTALVSRFRGQQNELAIRQTLGQLTIIMLGFMAAFFCVAVFFLETFLGFLNTPAAILPMAVTYIGIIMLGMGFMFAFFSFQSFSVGLGDTLSPMYINIISVVANIILDPILIYGLNGFPQMGIKGAAIATLFSRILAVVIAIVVMFVKFRKLIPEPKFFIPNLKLQKTIFSIAVPSSMAMTTTSFGFIFMQSLVNSLGTSIISAHAIGNRLVNFIMMPPMGISSALATIVGQNLGAGKVKRAVKSFHVALVMSMIIMTCGSSILWFFGDSITSIFLADKTVVGFSNEMLKINSIAVWIFGFLFMFWGVFNGSGHTRPVMIIDFFRLWVIRLPLAYLLCGYFVSRYTGDNSWLIKIINWTATILGEKSYTGLWWPMIVSNFISVLIAFYIYSKGTWKKALATQD